MYETQYVFISSLFINCRHGESILLYVTLKHRNVIGKVGHGREKTRLGTLSLSFLAMFVPLTQFQVNDPSVTYSPPKRQPVR